MFNPLAADELAMMLSGVLRSSARWDRPLEPFETAQLLSASSIARYLSAELADGASALRSFRDTLDEALRAELDRVDEGPWAIAVRDCLGQLRDREDPRELGMLIGHLLDAGKGLDADPDREKFADFRPRLHALFKGLAAAEITILANAGKSGEEHK